jgi:hypothetical protein
MSQREARADVKELSHVTFFAGATDTSVVPEMPGIDPANRQAVRGALSYFVARAIEGLGPNGNVTREQLFKFVTARASSAASVAGCRLADCRRNLRDLPGRRLLRVINSGRSAKLADQYCRSVSN